MIAILCILLAVTTTIAGVFIWRSFHLATQLDELESNYDDVISYYEKSMSVLQSVLDNIERVSKIDVISEEPVVKQLVSSIKTSRNTLRSYIDAMNSKLSE